MENEEIEKSPEKENVEHLFFSLIDPCCGQILCRVYNRLESVDVLHKRGYSCLQLRKLF